MQVLVLVVFVVVAAVVAPPLANAWGFCMCPIPRSRLRAPMCSTMRLVSLIPHCPAILFPLPTFGHMCTPLHYVVVVHGFQEPSLF